MQSFRRNASRRDWGNNDLGSDEEIVIAEGEDINLANLLGNITGGDDSFKEPSYLETINNRIYFYGDIDRHRILQLNKKLRSLDIAIQNDNRTWEIPQSPSIYLHINSNGGSIFAGLAGMDEIIQTPTNVTTIIDGACASAATFLSVVGDRRLMNKNACILIHQLSSVAWGTYAQMKDEMKNLEMLMAKIKEIYTKHTRIPSTELNKLLEHDLWLTAEQSFEYGLVDEIIGG